jgi:anti-sigma factor RsiW
MSERRHLGDELQELLDGRLAGGRESEVRAHLAECSECRSALDALGWTRSVAALAAAPTLPKALEGSILQALRAADRRETLRRRGFLAVAAGLLGGGAAFWLVSRSRGGTLPRSVARDYARFRAGQLPLEIEASPPTQVEALFRRRGLAFRTRVFDLSMMNYRVRGGRVHRLEGRPSALLVYEGGNGNLLVCQMYQGSLDQLPPGGEIRSHRGFTFRIYRQANVTSVFWQEGDVTCVLAGDIDGEQVIALAFEKAML